MKILVGPSDQDTIDVINNNDISNNFMDEYLTVKNINFDILKLIVDKLYVNSNRGFKTLIYKFIHLQRFDLLDFLFNNYEIPEDEVSDSYAFGTACRIGDEKIIKYLIDKDAKINYINIKSAFNNKDNKSFKYLIENYKLSQNELDETLYELVKFISKDESDRKVSIDLGYYYVTRDDILEKIKILVDKGANIRHDNDKVFKVAMKTHDMNLFVLIVKLGNY